MNLGGEESVAVRCRLRFDVAYFDYREYEIVEVFVQLNVVAAIAAHANKRYETI